MQENWHALKPQNSSQSSEFLGLKNPWFLREEAVLKKLNSSLELKP
jgi:hypothetical protein